MESVCIVSVLRTARFLRGFSSEGLEKWEMNNFFVFVHTYKAPFLTTRILDFGDFGFRELQW